MRRTPAVASVPPRSSVASRGRPAPRPCRTWRSPAPAATARRTAPTSSGWATAGCGSSAPSPRAGALGHSCSGPRPARASPSSRTTTTRKWARSPCGLHPSTAQSEPRRKLEAAYAAGVRHGITRSWHPNGARRAEYRYEHGNLAAAQAWSRNRRAAHRTRGAPRRRARPGDGRGVLREPRADDRRERAALRLTGGDARIKEEHPCERYDVETC